MSPTRSAPPAFGPSAGESARSMLAANVCAVIGAPDGGEKRRPGRIVNA